MIISLPSKTFSPLVLGKQMGETDSFVYRFIRFPENSRKSCAISRVYPIVQFLYSLNKRRFSFFSFFFPRTGFNLRGEAISGLLSSKHIPITGDGFFYFFVQRQRLAVWFDDISKSWQQTSSLLARRLLERAKPSVKRDRAFVKCARFVLVLPGFHIHGIRYGIRGWSSPSSLWNRSHFFVANHATLPLRFPNRAFVFLLSPV